APALLSELVQLPPPPVEEPIQPGKRNRPRPLWVDPKRKTIMSQEISDALPRLIEKSFTLALIPLGAGLGFGAVLLGVARWITPGKSRASLITLQDAQRVRSYAAFRPARGGDFELECPG